MLFLAETVISGLLTGVMYSLVALGFVLIFKASGVFNFAQGVMALFAGLTLAGFLTGTIPITHRINSALAMPPWLAITATVFVMIGLAILIERLVLRHLVNQEPIILFMMTLGLAYVLEGAGDLLWGSDVKVLDLGLSYSLRLLSVFIEPFVLVRKRDGAAVRLIDDIRPLAAAGANLCSAPVENGQSAARRSGSALCFSLICVTAIAGSPSQSTRMTSRTSAPTAGV